MKTAERMVYEFLKFYLSDDQALVEGWRSKDDMRWLRAVKWFKENVRDSSTPSEKEQK